MSCQPSAGPPTFIRSAGAWESLLVRRSLTFLFVPQSTCRVPACTRRPPKPPRPGAAPGRHATVEVHFFRWGCGSTSKASALQADSCGSVTRYLHPFPRELPRLADCKSAVKKRAGSRPVERYHQLPPYFMEHVRHRRGHCLENSCGQKPSRVRFSGAPPFPYAGPPQMQSIPPTRVLNPVLSGESPDAVALRTPAFRPLV